MLVGAHVGATGSRASPSKSTNGAPVGVPAPISADPACRWRSFGYPTNSASTDSVPETVRLAAPSTWAAVVQPVAVSAS